MTLAAGTKLGPYEILSSLGADGMVEVYRARDRADRSALRHVAGCSRDSEMVILILRPSGHCERPLASPD